MKARLFFRKLAKYFLQGLIILAPIAITIWAISGLFNYVDSILPNLVDVFAPHLLPHNKDGQPVTPPGSGLVVVILIVMFVGYVSSSFVVSRLVDLFDKVLEKTPGIKIIYSTVKDFLEAFAGNKRKFDRSVLVAVESTDIWRVGFITQNDAVQFGLQDYMAVYIPQSYAFAGHLYFVRKERVRLLKDVSAAEAMKFAISGGVTDIIEEQVPARHKGASPSA